MRPNEVRVDIGLYGRPSAAGESARERTSGWRALPRPAERSRLWGDPAGRGLDRAPDRHGPPPSGQPAASVGHADASVGGVGHPRQGHGPPASGVWTASVEGTCRRRLGVDRLRRGHGPPASGLRATCIGAAGHLRQGMGYLHRGHGPPASVPRPPASGVDATRRGRGPPPAGAGRAFLTALGSIAPAVPAPKGSEQTPNTVAGRDGPRRSDARP